ncbi:cupin domain-containing protein [Mucilaginibacter lappiensis]|uniref:Quercetin dioxygenase-like cupin family protein n=1 Tax=Mucilaginibacter lappiensis TaxID=354630 RepID=A0A841JB03_9SPHI|nr:cupin domain-containing protein [Mucilaginibacter lappiensis]MBB6127844.1 quercetin dioxygenase-like cupin family protein [Mucilaginibacter lappiensis]
MKNLVVIMMISLAFAGAVNAANLSPVKNTAGYVTLKDSIIRKRIFMAEFPARNVSSVDVREITFKPKQKTGRHLHPIPVMGYIVSGTVLFEAEGQSARVLHAGDAFYEPANTPIAHFDNQSDTEPLKFVAYYLLNGETELIKMLPEKSGK